MGDASKFTPIQRLSSEYTKAHIYDAYPHLEIDESVYVDISDLSKNDLAIYLANRLCRAMDSIGIHKLEATAKINIEGTV